MCVCVCVCVCVCGHCLSGGLENFDAGGLIEEQWSCIKKAITSSAKAAIGHERRSSPDWFVQSAATLEPILKARNDLYRKCHSGSRADLVAYREARGEARAAVRSAKESWLSKQADIVEAEQFNTKSAWAAIRAIQRCFGGITPMKVAIHPGHRWHCMHVVGGHLVQVV